MSLLKQEHKQMKRVAFEKMVSSWLKDGKITHKQSQQAMDWYNKDKPKQETLLDIYPDMYREFKDNYKKHYH